MKNNNIKIYFLIILSMVFWALSFVWYKEVYQYFRPITVVFLRLVISSFILLIATNLMKKIQVVEKSDYKVFALLVFFEPFVYFIGESFGVQLVSSTVAAVVISTIPLFTPVASYFFNKEKITLTNFLGIIISISGVFLVMYNKQESLNASFKGLLLLCLAVIGAIGYSIIIVRLSTKYNSFTIITYQNIIGIFYFLPIFLFYDVTHFIETKITIEALVPLFKLSIFASSLAFIFYIYGLSKVGINKANIFVNLIPVFTAIFAYFILGDSLNIMRISGIIVVVTGLFVSQSKPASIFYYISGKDK